MFRAWRGYVCRVRPPCRLFNFSRIPLDKAKALRILQRKTEKSSKFYWRENDGKPTLDNTVVVSAPHPSTSIGCVATRHTFLLRDSLHFTSFKEQAFDPTIAIIDLPSKKKYIDKAVDGDDPEAWFLKDSWKEAEVCFRCWSCCRSRLSSTTAWPCSAAALSSLSSSCVWNKTCPPSH